MKSWNDNKNGSSPCIFKCIVLSVFLKGNRYDWTVSHSWIEYFFFLTLCTELELANVFPCGSPRLAESYFICWGGSCTKCHSWFWGNHTADQKSNQAVNNLVLLAWSLPLQPTLCSSPLYRQELCPSEAVVPLYEEAIPLENSLQNILGKTRKCFQIQNKKVPLQKWNLYKDSKPYILLSSWTASKSWLRRCPKPDATDHLT